MGKNNCDSNAEPMNFIFAYGSLINNSSRRATVFKLQQHDNDVTHTESNFTDRVTDEAYLGYLSPLFGHRRAFIFHAAAFTALGLLPINHHCFSNADSASIVTEEPTCGVIFYVSKTGLIECDIRERGYKRIVIPSLYISVINGELQNNAVVWTYVPDDCNVAKPTEDFPILQTYVDLTLRGCLEWGGEELALQFIKSTHCWSKYFLNDAPMSRRPWLYRHDYCIIDKCLENCSEWIKGRSLHPEEYGTRHLTEFRGIWGVPPRNHLFVGRDAILSSLQKKLQSTDSSGIAFCELTGIGGVGKTQISIEYCHRYFGEIYSLIVFIRAETPALLISDLRRIAEDLGFLKCGNTSGAISSSIGSTFVVENGSSNTSTSNPVEYEIDVADDEVIELFKSRLARCRARWLLVFDNAEDFNLIMTCLPRGTLLVEGKGGHVIFTTRNTISESLNPSSRSENCFHHSSTTLRVPCFDEIDSVRYLEKSLAHSNDDQTPRTMNIPIDGINNCCSEQSKLRILANKLGQLPLALSMASAYLSRCDVSVAEYLSRLDRISFESPSHEEIGYEYSILTSLLVSLDRIQKDSESAVKVLLLLGWVSPDGITKSLLYHILKNFYFKKSNSVDVATGTTTEIQTVTKIQSSVTSLESITFNMLPLTVAASISLASISMTVLSRRNISVLFGNIFVASIALVYGIGIGVIAQKWSSDTVNSSTLESLSTGNSFETQTLPSSNKIPQLTQITFPYEDDIIEAEADRVWNILQQFSLITVRGVRGNRVGSIHRLHQSALRSRCVVTIGETKIQYYISGLVSVFNEMWLFDSNDPATWDDRSLSLLLNHIQVLKDHKFSLDDNTSRSFASLLTTAASYSQLVLSRFDVARDLLEAACNIRGTNFTDQSSYDEHSQRLHMLGKVMRILGLFDVAESNLRKALKLRKDQVSKADTLHELGVLYMRMHDNKAALDFLTQSLTIKKELSTIRNSSDRSEVESIFSGSCHNQNLNQTVRNSIAMPLSLETSESATLYSISIIRTSEGDYDEAQLLLLQVLALIDARNDDSKSVVSRAASLQQLGRVLMRKGQLVEAESRFSEALSLYFAFYGRQSHMNKAAVHHQLGQCKFAMKKYQEAVDQFTYALQCREEMMCGGSGNLDLVHEIQSVGQVELELGRTDSAEAYYERQSSLCNQILSDTSQEISYWLLDTDNTSGNHASAVEIFESLPPAIVRKVDSLVRSLLFAIYAMRGICKRRGDNSRATDLKLRGKSVFRRYEALRRSQQSQAYIEVPFPSKEPISYAQPCDDRLLHMLLSLRNKVRSTAGKLSQANGNYDETTEGSFIEPLVTSAMQLKQYATCELQSVQNPAAASADSNMRTHPLTQISLAFVSTLLSYIESLKIDTKTIKNPPDVDTITKSDGVENLSANYSVKRSDVVALNLFKQCDTIRSKIRELGLHIVDSHKALKSLSS